jgi:hypothetical protein
MMNERYARERARAQRPRDEAEIGSLLSPLIESVSAIMPSQAIVARYRLLPEINISPSAVRRNKRPSRPRSLVTLSQNEYRDYLSGAFKNFPNPTFIARRDRTQVPGAARWRRCANLGYGKSVQETSDGLKEIGH